MNSIRITESQQTAWLKVTKLREQGNQVVVQSTLFDGTLFELIIDKDDYQDKGSEVPGLLEVGHNGTLGSIAEIVLPRPVLNYGHVIRVHPDNILTYALKAKLEAMQGK